MDGKAQSSTIHSSETADNSPASSRPQRNEAAHEAAEYLRSFGLTVNFEGIFQGWMLDEPRKLVELPDEPTGLISCDGLPNCTTPFTVSAPDQWDVHDKSLSLLRDVCKRQSEAEVEDCMRQIRERTEADSVRRLKLELPALRTDNEIDLRRYQRRIRVARQVHLSAHHLPLEPCDEDKDEGLDFPPQAHAADRKIVQAVQDEKIEISKHAFETLLRHLKADWTEADQNAMLGCQVEYKGLIPREPVTPPLTPIIHAQDAFVPDEETCNVPQPSDPSSLVSADLREAEGRLFDEDGGNLDVSMTDIEQLLDFESADEVDLILLPDSVQKRDDLTVEEPLMLAVIQDDTQVSPNFGEIRESIAQANTTSDDVPCRDTERQLTESLKETAARVMMEIEQEKLEPLDATIRVDVPIVDFSIPEPEWCNQLGDSLAIFRSVPRQSGVMFNSIRWTRKLVEESKMVWRIWISREPKPAVEEPIDNEALVAAYLEPPEDASIPTSSDFVRKQPGLAILRDNEDDDEDEIQPLVVPPQPPQSDWMALIKKRKLFLDGHDSLQKSTSKTLHGDEPRGDRPRAVLGKLLVQEDEGAAAALLDNYMEMHAPKKMRTEHSPFFKATQSRTANEPRTAKQILDKNPQQSNAPIAKAYRAPKNVAQKTPGQADVPTPQMGRLMVCPDIPHLDRPLKMVVAVNIPRGMIQHLERLLPGLQMIDRDYNAHNMSVWMPGSVCRSETASSIADEADLIPSPSTGIVLTTLIKVRQKPLPGGPKAKPSLTSRIESIAARYERLIVLVSEGNKLDESASAVSASDAAALVGLQAFAATLPAETTVLYVGGGVETLARWAAAVAARHAAGCAAHVRDYLAQDETHWELFLRRAGMNAYAAQVMLRMLRAPEGEPLLSHERAYGLPALVKMSAEQRSTMFEGVLGGRRVLASVGRVLDARWGDVGPGRS